MLQMLFIPDCTIKRLCVFIYLQTEECAVMRVIIMNNPVQVPALTWYDFMETVTVAEMIVALEPLRPLAQGPTLHVCFVVLHQSVLKQNGGALVVASVIHAHCRCERALWMRDRRCFHTLEVILCAVHKTFYRSSDPRFLQQ